MSEQQTSPEAHLLNTLTNKEIERAKLGCEDFARALEKASPLQLFLLTGAGEYSKAIQGIFIGAKPVFADDFDQFIPKVGDLFPRERFKIIDDRKFIYDPNLVRETINEYSDFFTGCFLDVANISLEELDAYINNLGKDWFDPSFDHYAYDVQLGVLLGIPIEDVVGYAKGHVGIGKKLGLHEFGLKHSSNPDLTSQLRSSIKKLHHNGFNLNTLSTEQKTQVLELLSQEFPPDFVNWLDKRQSVYVGPFQYVSVTDSGSRTKEKLDALYEASKLKELIKRTHLLSLALKKIFNPS